MVASGRVGVMNPEQYIQMLMQMKCLTYLFIDMGARAGTATATGMESEEGIPLPAGGGVSSMPADLLTIMRAYTKPHALPDCMVEREVQDQILHERSQVVQAQLSAAGGMSASAVSVAAAVAAGTPLSQLPNPDPALIHFHQTSLQSLIHPPNGKQVHHLSTQLLGDRYLSTDACTLMTELFAPGATSTANDATQAVAAASFQSLLPTIDPLLIKKERDRIVKREMKEWKESLDRTLHRIRDQLQEGDNDESMEVEEEKKEGTVVPSSVSTKKSPSDSRLMSLCPGGVVPRWMEMSSLALNLFELQSKVRAKLLRAVPKEQLWSDTYRSRKDVETSIRMREKLEKRNRIAAEKELKRNRRQFLATLTQHARDFTNFHRERHKKYAKTISQAILKYFDEKVKRTQESERSAEKQRLALLKENNTDAYFALLKEAKNERLLTLLKQTDEYMDHLSRQILHEQEQHAERMRKMAVSGMGGSNAAYSSEHHHPPGYIPQASQFMHGNVMTIRMDRTGRKRLDTTEEHDTPEQADRRRMMRIEEEERKASEAREKAAAAAATAAGTTSGEATEEKKEGEQQSDTSMVDAVPTSATTAASNDPTSDDSQSSRKLYYSLAHRKKEIIEEQPKMLKGGKLRSYQMEGLQWLVSLYNNQLNGILADEMGLGKCWAAGTRLMMYNGEFKQVQCIKEGEALMGDDGTPRIVQPRSLVRGRGAMYEVRPINNSKHASGRDSWRCNGDHILVLRIDQQPWVERIDSTHDRWYVRSWSTIPGSCPQSSIPVECAWLDHGATFDSHDAAQSWLASSRHLWTPLEVECSVNDYMVLPTRTKSVLKMFQPRLIEFNSMGHVRLAEHIGQVLGRRVCMEDDTDVELVQRTAWCLGLWIGRRCQHQNQPDDVLLVQQNHTEIIDAIHTWYQKIHGPHATPVTRDASLHHNGTPLLAIHLGPLFHSLLSRLNLTAALPHIPLALLTEPIAIRRALLSGLIDASGDYECIHSQSSQPTQHTYKLRLHGESMLEDVMHLVRGLGFACHTSSAAAASTEPATHILSFTGADISLLQPILSSKRCPSTSKHSDDPSLDSSRYGIGEHFNVVRVEDGEYFGFTVDGNSRFLMHDFVVTHNTVQSLSLLAYLMEVKHNFGPFLIIVPMSTLHNNWEFECERWLPDVAKVVYDGDKDRRRYLRENFIKPGHFNIVMTTFEFAMRDKTVLRKIPWAYIIIDEAHRLKNPSCKLALELATYPKESRRVALTGTPLQNELHELWSLLNFLHPSIFNSCDSFERWFSSPFDRMPVGSQDKEKHSSMNEEEKLLVINRLHSILRPFMLRREKKQVESDLADKIEKVVRCELTPLQKVMYESVLDGRVAMHNRVMQLRKIANHPMLFHPYMRGSSRATPFHPDETLVQMCGKFMLLDQILHKLKRTGHRVLIFNQMTRVMDILESYCHMRGFTYLRLDGSTPADQRSAAVQAYNHPESKYFIFMLSTKAGGLGLNLQAADTVILFDSDWNPQNDEQAMARSHRIGQKQQVLVLRFITTATVEEHVLSTATTKLSHEQMVIQAGMFHDHYSQHASREIAAQAMARERGDRQDETGDDEAEAWTDDFISRTLARSDEELEIFFNMDRQAKFAEMSGKMSRSLPEGKMPKWVWDWCIHGHHATSLEQGLVSYSDKTLNAARAKIARAEGRGAAAGTRRSAAIVDVQHSDDDEEDTAGDVVAEASGVNDAALMEEDQPINYDAAESEPEPEPEPEPMSATEAYEQAIPAAPFVAQPASVIAAPPQPTPATPTAAATATIASPIHAVAVATPVPATGKKSQKKRKQPEPPSPAHVATASPAIAAEVVSPAIAVPVPVAYATPVQTAKKSKKSKHAQQQETPILAQPIEEANEEDEEDAYVPLSYSDAEDDEDDGMENESQPLIAPSSSGSTFKLVFRSSGASPSPTPSAALSSSKSKKKSGGGSKKKKSDASASPLVLSNGGSTIRLKR